MTLVVTMSKDEGKSDEVFAIGVEIDQGAIYS